MFSVYLTPKPNRYWGLQVFRPRLSTPSDLKAFHSSEYIEFLEKVTPENQVCIHSMLCKTQLPLPSTLHASVKASFAMPDAFVSQIPASCKWFKLDTEVWHLAIVHLPGVAINMKSLNPKPLLHAAERLQGPAEEVPGWRGQPCVPRPVFVLPGEIQKWLQCTQNAWP